MVKARTNNRREYFTQELECFLSDKGFFLQSTVLYTPEQNGVAERYNRTLIEATHSMLVDAGFPNRFGLKQLHQAFLRNRSPTKPKATTPVNSCMVKCLMYHT
jgi:hypothetical protein